MGKSILVTGGARSGKSLFAEKLALTPTGRATYVATAEARDEEMRARIDRHIARRGAAWVTLEEPTNLLSTLEKNHLDRPVLVDCLTLWLSNLMEAGIDWHSAMNDLSAAIPDLPGHTIFVTNEVGWGIVPDNAMARAYRDALGLMNQTIAAACDEVYLTVAGCPLRIKPNDTFG